MKNVKILFFSLLTLISLHLKAQDSADSLLNDLTAETEQVKLLPDRMLITQRMFWGENGIYRKVGIAPKLTAENRQRELRIRRNMFKIHQIVGITTAAAMLAQGILGANLYKVKSPDNYDKIKKAHEATALGINIAYTTTALMSFTAPPKQISRKGFNSGNVHKALSYIHLSGMIATNVLSKQINKPTTDLNRYQNMKMYHRAAAFTTFTTYYAAIAILKFEF
jgi:hypothetical protein